MKEPRPRITSARPSETRVERREALEDPHGIVRAEHRDGRAEPDVARLPGDRREHDVGRGDREVRAVVLAEPEEVEPEPVGQHGLGDDVAHHLRLRQRLPVRVHRHVAERVQPQLQRAGQSSHPQVEARARSFADHASEARRHTAARAFAVAASSTVMASPSITTP